MEQQSQDQEVLIARDNATGQVGAVVGQNPDGTPQLADAKKAGITDLIKFSKGQNPLEAFMSNFLRQAKNPSTFGFFRLPADQYEKIAPAMIDLIKTPEENADMLKPYMVDPATLTQHEKVESRVANVSTTPVNPDKLDWPSIEKEWGVTRQQLEQSGDLKQMLYNHKSPNLVKVAMILDGQRIEAEAKLSFKHNPDGSVTLSPHFIRSKPNLDKEYRGYTFTADDKAQLLKTGNLGRVVELAEPTTGEIKKCLVGLDRQTNEIESQPVDKIFIRQKIANLELTMNEIGILKNGGILRERDIELANGSKFKADLQYSVEKREVTFNSEPYRRQAQEQSRNTWLDADGNLRRLTQWCKLPMDDRQQADYLAGKQVRVGVTKDKFGNDCTVYVQYNPEKECPVTTREYPDRTKVVGVAEESKTQLSVNNDGTTNEATKNIKEPLVKGQTAPKDVKQDKEQKKTVSGPKL